MYAGLSIRFDPSFPPSVHYIIHYILLDVVFYLFDDVDLKVQTAVRPNLNSRDRWKSKEGGAGMKKKKKIWFQAL